MTAIVAVVGLCSLLAAVFWAGSDLEQTAARAANELRMASDQILTRFTVEHATRNGDTT